MHVEQLKPPNTQMLHMDIRHIWCGKPPVSIRGEVAPCSSCETQTSATPQRMLMYTIKSKCSGEFKTICREGSGHN